MFLCALEAKNKEQDSKTARKMAQAKERGGGEEERKFPSFLSPFPSFIFRFSFHFSCGQNRKSPSTVFFCSETKRKRLLRRLSGRERGTQEEIRKETRKPMVFSFVWLPRPSWTRSSLVRSRAAHACSHTGYIFGYV